MMSAGAFHCFSREIDIGTSTGARRPRIFMRLSPLDLPYMRDPLCTADAMASDSDGLRKPLGYMDFVDRERDEISLFTKFQERFLEFGDWRDEITTNSASRPPQ